MKRLALALVFAVFGVALLAPSAQAVPTLTKNEAVSAVFRHTFKVGNGYSMGAIPRKCSRLAKNRFVCAADVEIDTKTGTKSCRLAIAIVEWAEIHSRVLKRTCKPIGGRRAIYEEAHRAAKEAMDPKAFHINYELTSASGFNGRKRFTFQAVWTNGKKQDCFQTAKVILLKKKAKVSVSEVVCLDEPKWP